ncbi:Glutamate receptor 3.7 [Morella rubra]|uniref:Glutamate receptor 3.7 n=1 Tax=Morella rubra TaxID=262757 RepID=A0A6A1WGX8_9ROSI|nr:Glutamate receptor 3.7 [Morella rubra]
MPTDAKPLKIGVPGRTTFDKFVKVEYREKPNENRYDGFCIQIFYKLKALISHTAWFHVSGEKVYNNLTCLVIVVWLFVVLILTSSYTASLSSMLTVQQLQPNVTNIEWLKKNNLKVGCGQ